MSEWLSLCNQKKNEQKALQVLGKFLEGKCRQYWTRESHNKDGIKLHSCKWVRVCPRGAHTLRWLTTNARHSASQEQPHSHWLRAQRTAFLDSLKPWGSPTLSMGPQIHPPSGRKENLRRPIHWSSFILQCKPWYTPTFKTLASWKVLLVEPSRSPQFSTTNSTVLFNRHL